MISVFVDTNIIISGLFFSGLEAEILNSKGIRLITADICKEETIEVVERKFDDLSSGSLETVIHEVEEAFLDIDVIVEREYEAKIGEAGGCVKGDNDRKVLAAVLTVRPDYFITGDEDFYNDDVEERVEIVKSRELLEHLR